MALIQADRVKETTTTTGTGSYNLAGAETGFQSFSNGVGTNNTCYYVCTDGIDYEIGLGTLSYSTTLARTTVITSSNSNNAVNWGSGTREIFTTYPGSKAVILNSSGNLDITGALAVTGDTDVTNFSANGTLDVSGNGSVGGTFVITGDTDVTNFSANGTLDVSGNGSVGGTLVVTGDTDVTNISANGTLDVSGNGSVGGTFNVEGDLKNTSGNLTVDPATQIFEIKGDGSSVEGQIQLNCHVNSHGQILKAQPHSEGVTNTMLLPKGSNSTLVSEVATQTLTNKTLGSTSVDGTFNISGAVSGKGTLTVTDAVSVASTLNIGGNVSGKGTLTVSDAVSVASTLNVGTNFSGKGTLTVTGGVSAASTLDVGSNTSVGGTLLVTGDSDVTNLSASGTFDVAGNASVGGTFTLNGTGFLDSGIAEGVKIITSTGGSTVNLNVNEGGILYYTGTANTNFTFNIRGDASTTLNSIMDTGDSLGVALMLPQDSTARQQTALQIDGAAVSKLYWQGGATGEATGNGIEVFAVNIVKTGDADYTVLESITNFLEN